MPAVDQQTTWLITITPPAGEAVTSRDAELVQAIFARGLGLQVEAIWRTDRTVYLKVILPAREGS